MAQALKSVVQFQSLGVAFQTPRNDRSKDISLVGYPDRVEHWGCESKRNDIVEAVRVLEDLEGHFEGKIEFPSASGYRRQSICWASS